MRITLPRVLIVAVVVLELLYIIMPRYGSYPVSPRVRQAIMTHESSSKSEKDAAIAEAFAQDAAGADQWAIAFFALVIGINIALIYFFWNYGTRPKGVSPTNNE